MVDLALGSSSCEKPADVRQGQDGRRMPREAHPPPKGLPRLSGLGLGFFFFPSLTQILILGSVKYLRMRGTGGWDPGIKVLQDNLAVRLLL